MTAEEILDKLSQALREGEKPSDLDINLNTSKILAENLTPTLLSFFSASKKVDIDAKKDESNLLWEFIQVAVKAIGNPLLTTYNFLDMFINKDSTSDLLKGYDTLQKTPILGDIYRLVFNMLVTFTLVLAEISSAKELTVQNSNKARRPHLLDYNSIVEQWFRNPDSSINVHETLARYGLKEEDITTFLNTKFELMPLSIIRFNYLRNNISPEETKKALRKLKYEDKDLDNIIKSFKVYPSVHDYVSFALRESYFEDIVEKYKLYDDMPEEFLVDCEKIGLERDYAKLFWYSHWRPPSVTQADEMLHREAITDPEHTTLLRINDIMPGFRKAMKKISYNVVTRVDARRFFKSNVYDYDDLLRVYKHMGYSPEDAVDLADYTALQYDPEDRDLTRTDIISLYNSTVYTPLQATNALLAIGYTEQQASDILLRADIDKENKRLNRLLSKYKQGYIRGRFQREETLVFLSTEGFTEARIHEILWEWDVERESKTALLSKSDIKAMVKKDIIKTEQAIDRLLLLSYKYDDAILLIQLWGVEDK